MAASASTPPLSKDEIRSLTVALDALSEPISQVAGVVASK